MNTRIDTRIAQSDDDIARCFLVMQQLRTHLVEAEFVDTVRRQQRTGYHLAFLEADGQVRSVAGFRFIENLVRGKVLYVDDLSTDAAARSRGYGGAVLDWLVQHARDEDCLFLELDSGVQRFDAHRFYLAKRMFISSHHFSMKL